MYTALIGGYERLQEQPVATSTDVPFICLTDDATLASETWEVRVVEPALLRDPSRSSRFPKILGEPLVPGYDETLWLDNRVRLEQDPDVVLDTMLAEGDIGVLHHSYRTSVMAEFDEVARRGLDDPARIYEQLIHYAETRPHVLDERPYWGGLIARRWTPEVRAAMRTWLDHVLRYSRRDQLSFRYALDGLACVRAHDLDNFDSDWHTWLTDDAATERQTRMRTDAFRTSIRAPLAVVAELESEVSALRAALESERQRSARAAETIDALRTRAARRRVRIARLQAGLTAEKKRSRRLESRVADLDGRPARRVARAVRRRLPGRRTD